MQHMQHMPSPASVCPVCASYSLKGCCWELLFCRRLVGRVSKQKDAVGMQGKWYKERPDISGGFFFQGPEWFKCFLSTINFNFFLFVGLT